MHCISFPSFSSYQISPVPPEEGEEDVVEEPDGIRDMFGLMSKRQHKETIEVGLMGEGVNGLLRQLFECLPSELETLILFGERIDQ